MDEQPVIGLVGSGPAAEAVEAAGTDVDARVEAIDTDEAGGVDLPVVVAPSGRSAFRTVDGTADGPWIAVELGGVGGRAMDHVDAAVSVCDPTGGCFDCLRARVRSNADGAPADAPTTTRRDARLAGAHAGRLAAGVLAGEVEPGRLLELPHAERRFLPVPGCGCTKPSSRTLDRTHETVSVEAAVDRMEAAVDDRVGLVAEIGEVHSFPAPYYLARLCDTTTFADAEAGPQAAGVDVDWNAAFAKAVGEALERYAAGVYRRSRFDVAAATDLDEAVPPSAFVRPEGFETFGPEEPIPWLPGESLHDGRSVALPAEFVVFPPPAHRFAPSITTGLGLGTSGVGALHSGLYEVVERDATMLAWYSSFDPMGLRVEDPGFETLARRARAEDLSVTPLLLTQDVDVPIVAVAVHREGEWPRFAVGSGASLDANDAARSALAEGLQNWMELRAMGNERSAEESTAIGEYADLPDAARSMLAVDATVAAADLGPAEPPTGEAEIAAVAERLDAVGLEAFAARLTTPDLERLGLEVVRVLVPGAQPLFTGEAFFGDRAETVPRDLGFEPRLDRAPHPYP